jgi:anoctamin-10
VSDEDFTALRNHYGEKVTLYFAFTQFYGVSLIPLAVFGIIAWMFLPQYHPSYSLGLALWTIAFRHTWQRRQRELAIKWGVKGFAFLVEQRRAAFVSEGTRVDPVTSENVGWFPKCISIRFHLC